MVKRGLKKNTKAVYRSCATLAVEGEREKDARMERSILRVIVGEVRCAELPNNVRRGVVGVD